MKNPKLSLRENERYDETQFSIIRLGGTGAGTANIGERYRLVVAGVTVAEDAVVIAVEDVRLSDISCEKAAGLTRSPKNTPEHIQALLEELYKFRPRWNWDETVFRILTLRRYGAFAPDH